MQQSTISSHYVQVLLANIKSHKVNVNQLLVMSGIPIAILNNPQIRIGNSNFAALLKNVQDLMQDEGLGYYQRPQKIGTTNILVSHMSTAENVEEALQFAADFYSILNLGVSLSVHHADQQSQRTKASQDDTNGIKKKRRTNKDDEEVILRLNVSKSINRHWVYEEVLMKIHRIIRWLANERITISKVRMPFAKVDHVSEYHLIFGAPVEFESIYAELVFTKKQVSTLLHRPHKDVKRHFHDFRYHILALTVDPKSYTEKVRIAIKDNLPEDCSYDTISKQLSMHPQTLRRRLHAEGTEFTSIKNDIIRDLAIDYIGRKDLSIKQIAFLLNFSAPSSFNRAFKQWTGMSPVAFQKTLDDLPENEHGGEASKQIVQNKLR